MLPCNAPDNTEVIFFPYWRFKGMLFSCVPGGVKHKFLDISHQAIESPHAPYSLGFRSQALKLRFVTPETEGRFLKPSQTFDQVVQIFEKRFAQSLPKPIFHQIHIGESISLIYSPFYVDNKIFDAVLNKPIPTGMNGESPFDGIEGGPPTWRIHFISTLCPKCGWDLEGQRDTLVLHCRNCVSAWYPVGKKLKQLKFAHMPDKGEKTLYLPFWRVKAEVSGVELKSYADLIRMANLPKVAKDRDADIDFRFWIPAFKVRPQMFMRLAGNFTIAQLQNKLTSDLPAEPHHPVTVPVKEALECLKTTLAGFLKPRREMLEKLGAISTETTGFALIYLPFHEKHSEYVQPHINLAINKNLLRLSKNL